MGAIPEKKYYILEILEVLEVKNGTTKESKKKRKTIFFDKRI